MMTRMLFGLKKNQPVLKFPTAGAFDEVKEFSFPTLEHLETYCNCMTWLLEEMNKVSAVSYPYRLSDPALPAFKLDR